MPRVKIEQELLSLSEAARLLHISHVQMWRLVHADRIPVVRVGTGTEKRAWYGVRPEVVDEYDRTRRLGRPRKLPPTQP